MSRQVVETLIARQLNQYNRLRSLLREESKPAPPAIGPVITISRMAGCCARDLAAALSTELGVQVWGRELVDLIATDRGLRHELVSRIDQGEVRDADAWMRGAISGRMFLKSDYVLALAQTLEALARSGGGVVVGRGAGFILGDRARLRLRLVAGRAYRIRTLMRERAIERAEAKQLLDRLDEARWEFVREYFHQDVDDARNYDLVVNVEHIEPAVLLQTCLELVRANEPRTREAEG
jgi:cytidylate kinase